MNRAFSPRVLVRPVTQADGLGWDSDAPLALKDGLGWDRDAPLALKQDIQQVAMRNAQRDICLLLGSLSPELD